MPKKFDPEVKDRAVRMVLDRVEEAGSVTKAPKPSPAAPPWPCSSPPW
ncbi:hypothetical protein [Micrococcus sp. KRD077]|nr:hypothetical protein [Micrococcus sp. KRD077]